jgi:hypothetical protein
MRRGYVLFAMIAMAVGGYAEAGFDSALSTNPVLNGIQSFIAQQRRADADICATLGRTDVEACTRDIARQRRARLEGPAAEPSEHPDDTEI